ncbi:Vacuolar protein sorting-associated protein atg6 [Rhodosporidiobolus nylandii]
MPSCQRCRQPLSPSSLPSFSPHSRQLSPHPPVPSHHQRTQPAQVQDSLAQLSASSAYDFLSASERLPAPPTGGAAGAGGARATGQGQQGGARTGAAGALYGVAARQAAGGGGTAAQRIVVPPSPSSTTGANLAPRTPLNPTDSFVVLTESVLGPPPASPASAPAAPVDSSSASSSPSAADPTALTPRLQQLSHLYSLLSSTSSVDHPLCTECTEVLLGLMAKELDEGRKERDRLVGFEREVLKRREDAKREGAPTGEKQREALEKDVAKLKKAETHAIAELKAVEAKKVALAEEAKLLDEEEAQLAKEEADFWTAHSLYLLKRDELLDRESALAQRLASAQKDLEKLERTNVYNDVFCIGQEGGFATINGLRFGRLPGVQVDWPELNAAWGHTLLLLLTLSRKFGLREFRGYRLVACGSFSRVEQVGRDGGVTSLELYGSSDLSVTRLLHNRRFDQAMVGFLECLRQLVEWVIVKDRIGDVSIKLQFGSDEAWTRALRHLLLDLKILLGRATQ